MNDVAAFKRVMELMVMVVDKTKCFGDKTLIIYSDSGVNTEQFTTEGYDEFSAGVLFDTDGNIIKAYIDSHVAYQSKNCEEIKRILN